uniref:Uncharacterized protein n=1 Tax=Hucho hucho TaxID=62062 RepID=A0A4W5LEF0_9TELE
ESACVLLFISQSTPLTSPSLPLQSASVDQTDSPLRLTLQVPVDDPTVTNGHQAGPGGPEGQALPSTTTRHPVQQISGVVSGSSDLSDSPLASPPVVVNRQNAFPLGPGQSPNGHQPSPINAHSSPLSSPLLTDAGYVRTDDEDEVRRKFPTDKAYFIAKELLTTERTFQKDLAVITVVRLIITLVRLVINVVRLFINVVRLVITVRD